MKIKAFLVSSAKAPTSPALLRLHHWLPNRVHVAGGRHGCTLLGGLRCPLCGQQQLLMLQTVQDRLACLLIKLDRELSVGANKLFGPLLKGLIYTQLSEEQPDAKALS